MRALILGATGMLGHQLLGHFGRSFDVAGTIRSFEASPAFQRLFPHARIYAGVAAEDLSSIRHAVEDWRADVVVNCIGTVKQVTSDPIPHISLNGLLPHELAKLTAASGSKLIHFSTDCVFSGSRGNYTEDDVPDPVDIYGRTKLLGEMRQSGVLTLRLSIVGRELRNRLGLIEWFLSQRDGNVKGYARALYSGLTTIALADLLVHLLRNYPALVGLWHVSADPISKFDLLQIVNRVYDLGIAIERDESFVCDRRLDSTKFRNFTGWRPSTWDDMIQVMFTEPGAGCVR